VSNKMTKKILLIVVLLMLQACDATLPSVPVQMTRKEQGAWMSQFKSGLGEAVTGNDSGSTFGLMCTSLDCNYYITTDVTCTPGSTYPALINFDEAVDKILLGCRAWKHENGSQSNIIWLEFSKSLNVGLSGASETSITFPMANGSFKIMKFNLSGYSSAVQRVIARMNPQSLRAEGLRDSIK
jgi:hypothetical protein